MDDAAIIAQRRQGNLAEKHDTRPAQQANFQNSLRLTLQQAVHSRRNILAQGLREQLKNRITQNFIRRITEKLLSTAVPGGDQVVGICRKNRFTHLFQQLGLFAQQGFDLLALGNFHPQFAVAIFELSGLSLDLKAPPQGEGQ